MRDLVVTWPKSRSLDSYLEELKRAEELELLINFRVANPPKDGVRGGRCFMVYDGAIRGFNYIEGVHEYGEKQVSRVKNDAFAGFWPAGWYLVRNPKWYKVVPLPMRGFQGWRYYDGDDPPT